MIYPSFYNINGNELILEIKRNDRASGTCQEIIIKYNKNGIFKKANTITWVAVFCILISFLFKINSNYLLTYVVLCIIIFIKLLMWFYDVKSENLLIIESVGMQITEAYPLGRTSSRFIPWHVIKDVFINEVIQLQRVIFILTILTETTSSSNVGINTGIIPIFTNTKPPLACLEIIYKSIQSTLNHFIVNASKDNNKLNDNENIQRNKSKT